jgi:outer membrane immunogenic protein
MEIFVKATLVVAALVAGVVASPAMAQEEEKHFEGPRVEALFGYDQAKAGLEATDDFNGDAEDIFYGAAIGYDFESGVLTYGVEAEIAGSGLAYEESGTDVDLAGSLVSGTLRVDSATEYYLGARVGFVGGRSSLYFKAGYAMSGIDIDFDGTVDGLPERVNADIDLDGLRLGVGAEYKVNDLVYIKAEYRYTDYSGADIEAIGQNLAVGDVFEVVNLERHQAVVGVGVRF